MREGGTLQKIEETGGSVLLGPAHVKRNEVGPGTISIAPEQRATTSIFAQHAPSGSRREPALQTKVPFNIYPARFFFRTENIKDELDPFRINKRHPEAAVPRPKNLATCFFSDSDHKTRQIKLTGGVDLFKCLKDQSF